jgi:phosphoribosylformylglycinamidine synthase I
MKTRICVLRTDGTNCDDETAYAFEIAGGISKKIHINELRSGQVRLSEFQLLAIPGGFSYGDDIASGKILANELVTFLRDQLAEFTLKGKPVIGICNGFQVLVRTGLLPFDNIGRMDATLAHNDSGVFHCGWYEMRILKSPCIFTAGLEDTKVEFQVAHGEGKYLASEAVLEAVEEKSLVALRYCSDLPNGSLNRIAGICNPLGNVFGLMPHPERFVEVTQHPNWRRRKIEPYGLPIFQNGVAYAAQL